MSEFVGDGVGDLEARIFVNVAGSPRLAHARDLRHAQRGAPVRHAATDVVPAHTNTPGRERKEYVSFQQEM